MKVLIRPGLGSLADRGLIQAELRKKPTGAVASGTPSVTAAILKAGGPGLHLGDLPLILALHRYKAHSPLSQTKPRVRCLQRTLLQREFRESKLYFGNETNEHEHWEE